MFVSFCADQVEEIRIYAQNFFLILRPSSAPQYSSWSLFALLRFPIRERERVRVRERKKKVCMIVKVVNNIQRTLFSFSIHVRVRSALNQPLYQDTLFGFNIHNYKKNAGIRLV